MIKVLWVQKEEKGTKSELVEIEELDIPEEEVEVKVHYSSINYKDALAVTGKGKIIRGAFPFVPGVDLVGEVVKSKSDQFSEGDWVIGNGWGLGEAYWGGYTQLARVKAKSLIPLPAGMQPHHAMALGTAGFTAMLSVMALQEHNVTPDKGEVVVTGATGGVGSIGIYLLAKYGYEVVASSGKSHAHSYLKELGASRIIDRDELGNGALRPLDKGKWAGAIDNVGGPALAAMISQMKRHASIASCGLAHKADFETTVYPFILRGVNLLGIDSGTCEYDRRCEAWAQLHNDVDTDVLERVAKVIPLADVEEVCTKMIESKIQGRFIVDLQG